MATTLIVVCDRCEARIAENRTALKPQCGPLRHDPAVDLCSACLGAFREFLGPPAGRKPAPAPHTDPRCPIRPHPHLTPSAP